MGGLRPLKCRDVERALRELGFVSEPTKSGGSHVKWVKTEPSRRYVVTVDCHRDEISGKNVRSIAAQAGVTAKRLYGMVETPKSRAGTAGGIESNAKELQKGESPGLGIDLPEE